MAPPVRLAFSAMFLVVAGVAGAQTKPPASAGAPPTTSPAPVLSESKFLGALYSEIEKHTPSEHTLGDGEVTASFHVNAAGRIDKVTIDKTSSPAHAEAVKQILAAVAAPPPPGGSMDVGQTFKFHKSEPEAPELPTPSASSPAGPVQSPKPAAVAPAR